jgi:hypothetical protein
MSPVNFIKWTANQCLNAKNIEVAEVHVEYLEDTKETQFTLVTPDGKIGVCKVSNDEFTVAVNAGQQAIRDFLTPRFELIEFTMPEPVKDDTDDGKQSTVPEVQPGPSKPKGRKRKPAKDKGTGDEDAEAGPDSADAGSSESETETEGAEPDAGQSPSETDE